MFDFGNSGLDSKHLFIIDKGNIVPCPDVGIWSRWMAEYNEPLAATKVGPFTIVTSFIGNKFIDEDGVEYLWATEVKPPLSGVPSRGFSVSSAAAMDFHAKVVDQAKEQAQVIECENVLVRRAAPKGGSK